VTDFKIPLRAEPGNGNQPFMPRCIAAVATCTYHIATVPSVRNTGVRESKASQVERFRLGSPIQLRRAD
jgi:hypothetical protein